MSESNQKDQKDQKAILVTNAKTGETTQLTASVKRKAPFSSSQKNISDSSESLHFRGPQSQDAQLQNSGIVAKDGVKRASNRDEEKKKDPSSVEDFIELFYLGKAKSLPDKIARKLNENILIQTISRPELIQKCLSHDNSLEKTRQLLVLTLSLKPFPRLERNLRDVARNIILSHPEMNGELLDNWFPFSGNNQPKNINELWSEFVSKSISNEPLSSKDGFEQKEEDKRSSVLDPQKSRRNAYMSTAVWRFAERFMSFQELIRELRSTIFVSSIAKDGIESKSLECLATSLDGKDRERVAVLLKWFSEQLDLLRNQSEQYRRKVDSLHELLGQSKDSIKENELEINKLKSEIIDLREQLDVSNENARVQGIHLRDDQHKQRGRTLRALEEEIPMLQDTLKALERDPPKIIVAKDYIARVLDNLNCELKYLRGN